MLLERDSLKVGWVVHSDASKIEGERGGLEEECDKQLDFFHSSIFFKDNRHLGRKPSMDL
jgi:hypothetical protein